MKRWIIALAAVLGLLCLNAYIGGDSIEEEQAIADHKAEVLADMRNRAIQEKLEIKAYRTLELNRLYVMKGKND
jgi:hypothetical protein